MKTDLKRDLSQEHMVNVFKLLFRLQLFIVGTTAISNIVGSIFAGMFLDTDAVAVIGLFGPVLSFIAGLSAVITSGITVLCGKAVSDGTKQDMDRIFTTSVLFGAVIGIIATGVLLSCAYPLAKLLGASDHLAGTFVQYAEGMALMITFKILVQLLMSFLQFGHKPKLTIHAILILSVSTIVLDYIMIVPLHLGVQGMALASSISNVITFIYLVIRFLCDRELMRVRPKLFSPRLIGKTVVIGSPGAISYLMWALRNASISRLAAEYGGDRALTAMSVRGTVDNFTTSLFNVALSGAFLILFSVLAAEENRKAISSLLKNVLLRYLPAWIVMVAAVMLLAEPIASIYVKPEDISYTAEAIRGFTPAILVSYPVVSLFALYKSLRRMTLVNILYVFNALLLPIGFAFIASKLIGIAGVWNLYWAAELLTILVLIVIAWINSGHFPRCIDDFCLFPKGFGIPESECMSFTLRTMSEVMLSSEEVIKFCKSKGIPSGRAMRTGLCIEEMAGNIIKHGFSKPHRHPERDIIDIRLCYKDGDILMRIWDNAPVFNPYTKVHYQENDDPTAEIGIRLVFNAVKEVEYKPINVKDAEYKTVFNQNMLTLRI